MTSPPNTLAKHRPALGAFAAVVAFATLLACFVPDLAPWGDGLRVVAVFADPARAPLFVEHIAFGPLAHAAVRLAALFGVDSERALELLTRACFVCGSGLAAAAAVRAGARPLAAVGWGCVAAAAPVVLLLQGVVEYHGVQFVAAAFALWLIAPLLSAERSRASTANDAIRTACACFVAYVGHGSHVLLVAPLLLVPFARRVSPRRLLAACAVAALILASCVYATAVVVGRSPDAAHTGLARAAHALGSHVTRVLELRAEYGWFHPNEVAEYLWHEWFAMHGLVLVGLVALFRRPKRRTDLPLVLALLVFALVVSQFGVRERGAYFLGLVPWIVVTAARATPVLPWSLLVFQLALGLSAVDADARRTDARTWLVGLEDRLAPPLVVYTSQMVRHSVVPVTPGYIDAATWYLRFDTVPRHAWNALAERLEQELDEQLARGNVYLDRDVLPPDEGDALPWQTFSAQFLASRGFRTTPVERRPVDSAPGADSAAEPAPLLQLAR